MKTTLLQLFERNEKEFRSELLQLRLPRDIDKLQSFLEDFFVNKVSTEEYRNELSLLEVGMLNSVIKLVSQTLVLSHGNVLSPSKVPYPSKSSNVSKSVIDSFNIPVLGATAVGGIIGGAFMRTWGGVLLSIAGCALGMYLSTDKKHNSQVSIDVDNYVDTLKNICQCIDNVMSNYSTSISNIIEEYEGRPKTTLASLYLPLLERMASLYIAIEDNNLPEEVKTEFNKLYRTLKNHHYEILNYNEQNSKYFIETESPNVDKPTVIKAAILEYGNLLESGECFIPIKK